MTPLQDIPPMGDPNAELEQAFISEYLASHHHDHASVERLPELERIGLLRDACVYAAARLAELEARVHYLHDIHGASQR